MNVFFLVFAVRHIAWGNCLCNMFLLLARVLISVGFFRAKSPFLAMFGVFICLMVYDHRTRVYLSAGGINTDTGWWFRIKKVAISV